MRKTKADSVRFVGINIAVEKITSALASYQSASLKILVQESRSLDFGIHNVATFIAPSCVSSKKARRRHVPIATQYQNV